MGESAARRRITAHGPLALPFVGIATLAAALALPLGGLLAVLCALALIGSVLAAVHHAEVVAHRVAEHPRRTPCAQAFIRQPERVAHGGAEQATGGGAGVHGAG